METCLAGVVVLYNPGSDIVSNIKTYIDNVDKLYLIDNSPQNNRNYFLNDDVYNNKIEYIFNNKNEGVAVAINKGATLARDAGYQWLLTMDQDSSFNKIYEMLSYIKNDPESKVVGIYSPFHDTGTRESPSEVVTYVRSVMTSGNILNLEAFFKIGMADERFFIDCIDHDICETFIQNKYFIKRLNFCKLKHALGNEIKIVNDKEITNHSPFRRYYITRNTFYYVEKHFIKNPVGSMKYFKSFLGNTLSCFLYESQRKEKLNFMLRGLKDYLLRRSGGMQ